MPGNTTMLPVQNDRRPDHPVDAMFVERWSPRAFTGEDLPVATLMTMFEAARWAPSSYNSQPWRFVWARRGTPHFETLRSLLTGANPDWCKDASALVFVVSSETMTVPGKPEPVPSRTHSFDAGSGWMSLALQAHLLGWHTHGMVGVNFAEAAETLRVPSGFNVEAAIAIGKRGDPGKLSEALRSREMPNERKPLSETVFEGGFPV